MAHLSVSNQVPAGAHGRPFGSATFDLGAFGYVEEEWFLRGQVPGYAPRDSAGLAPDGRWSVQPSTAREFATRLLVRRPRDSARFDGTAVLEWLNVSGGIDLDPAWAQSSTEIIRAGNAWIGVSAQRAGVNAPPLMPGFSVPLELWDPERYGSLAVPDDDLSYGIFTAAARVLRAGSFTAGATVDTIVAAGASQSANRLVTYVNGVHPFEGAIDAFLIHGRVGTSSPVLAADVVMPDPLTLRTDLRTPVLVLESEFDVLRSWQARQPDAEFFRLWEVAGSTHQDEYVERTLRAQFARDLDQRLPGCDCAVNDMPFHYVENAALSHLRQWVHGAPPAPELPRIEMRDGEIVRDEYGNARGGIRLPHLDVPTAQYGPVGTPDLCALRGFVKPFAPERLAALYPTRDAYLERFDAATRVAVEAGYLLAPDAAEARALLTS
jgi:hypothetical protein